MLFGGGDKVHVFHTASHKCTPANFSLFVFSMFSAAKIRKKLPQGRQQESKPGHVRRTLKASPFTTAPA
jgi:hypothetical protein